MPKSFEHLSRYANLPGLSCWISKVFNMLSFQRHGSGYLSTEKDPLTPKLSRNPNLIFSFFLFFRSVMHASEVKIGMASAEDTFCRYFTSDCLHVRNTLYMLHKLSQQCCCNGSLFRGGSVCPCLSCLVYMQEKYDLRSLYLGVCPVWFNFSQTKVFTSILNI